MTTHPEWVYLSFLCFGSGWACSGAFFQLVLKHVSQQARNPLLIGQLKWCHLLPHHSILSLQLLFWFLVLLSVLLSSTFTLAHQVCSSILLKNAELVFSHFHRVPGAGPGDDYFLRSLTYCDRSKELLFIFHRKVLLSQLPCFCLECMVFLLKIFCTLPLVFLS